MERIKAFIFSLRGKAIVIGAFCIVIFMGVAVYIVLSTEWSYYFRDREALARVLAETRGVAFANAILHQGVGPEGTKNIDYYIQDLLSKEKSILTISIFDNNGMPIAHSNLFDHKKFYKDAKEVIAHKSTFLREIKDKERGPVLETITPLMAGKKRIATLRIEFSIKDLYDRLTLRAERMFLRTLIAISGAVFLLSFGINAMLKPVRRLANVMDNIDYGRYKNIPIVPRNDELGVIERSFSSMVKRLKEADIKWENTFNSITDTISIHHMDYRLVKANNALALRLNTTPEALVGIPCWEIYDNSKRKCPNCPHEKTVKTGKPSVSEKEYRSLGGTFLSSTFPYFNEDGKMIGTIHVAKEITLEKKLQERLVKSEKMAAMGQIAAGIAHEINNPLNSITGYVSYLLEQLDETTPGKEELDKILKAAIRCKESVRKFLNLTREAPKKVEPVDIKEVIEDVLSMCHHTIFSQKIKVTKEITEQGLWVMADKMQMEEAVVNIVINACHAMKDGGELTLKAYEEGGSVKVEIADTGYGIAKEDIGRIFDPFFTTKEPGSGTGLGLAVSQTIIKNNGGAIDCHSTLGKGAAFIITLPGDKYAL